MSACLAGYLPAKPFSDPSSYAHAQLVMVTDGVLELAGHTAKSAVRKFATGLVSGELSNSAKKAAGSHQSDWAAGGLLRSGWQRSSDAVSFQWDDVTHHVSLIAAGHEVIRGPWETQITMDGAKLPTTNDWDCTCWFEDNEAAFVELEVEVADGIKHVRQVMLSLQEQFAILLDSVVSRDDQRTIELASSIPHASWLTASRNSITRDWMLQYGSVNVRTIPLWLPDDRLHSGAGDFFINEDGLQMYATGQGGATLPLFFDWAENRHIHDADWNRLTVTEERRVVSTNEAAAFRVRVGKLQVLLYRSFRTPDDLRAVLGQHTHKETLIGHVRNAGEVEPLVMVEGEDG